MWVKICGITNLATATAVAELAPDAIGLNFYAASPRSVTRVEAARIGRVISPDILRVGVFVNHDEHEIIDLVGQCHLDQIQLHGDESPHHLARLHERLPNIPMIRAWRMAGDSLDDLANDLRECSTLGVPLAACLIDARVSGAYGGTGHTVEWASLNLAYRTGDWPPLILAGGLTPDNAAAAVLATRPWGIDVASGVESRPGVKEIELVRRFIAAARTA
jgi:phosphoribosylanthranilate isomerase